MKDPRFRTRSVSALSTSALLATAALVLTGCTIVVKSPSAVDRTAEDGGARASVGLSWHLEGGSLDRYKLLDHEEHDITDRLIWGEILDRINDDGVDRSNRFRTYYNAPSHHEAHENPGAVRDWILENDILPSNPQDMDEDPDEIIYTWEDGVEYCEHEHEVTNSPTQLVISVRTSQGEIRAGVKLRITWRLALDYPGEGDAHVEDPAPARQSSRRTPPFIIRR